jgi:uncharacterized protein YndB with AHSA1/START domain
MDINQNAPVSASADILIHAPLRLVWEIQTDIDNWKKWNPDVTDVALQGPVAPGTSFRWKAGGTPIRSSLQVVEPERRIVWTGRMLSIRAIHVWTFEEQEKGVLVRTAESFDGFLVRLFTGTMQRMLESSLQKGLAVLKKECERRAGT